MGLLFLHIFQYILYTQLCGKHTVSSLDNKYNWTIYYDMSHLCLLISSDIVVSLTEIITNVDEVDLIMFNSISKSNTKSNKNNLDVVQLAASVRMICIQ